MCFSANASFIAGGVLTTLGAVSIYKARTPQLRLFAATPLLFAIQQTAEGIIWLTINEPHYTVWYSVAVYTFLFFAMVWWPLWIPLTIRSLETDEFRKKIIMITAGCGGFFAVKALIQLIGSGAQAVIKDHHIAYIFTGWKNSPGFLAGALIFLSVVISRKLQQEWLAWVFIPFIALGCFYVGERVDMTSLLYILAVTLPCFASSVRHMWLFGIGISGSLLATMYLFPATIGSVWCFLAALISGLIIFIVR